jgi:hypothetical protein
MPTVVSKYRGTKAYHLVYCRLLTAAQYRGTVTYQEIAKILRLPMKGSHMGREIGWILGEISEDEHTAERPMLSAVAVNVGGGPGPGFFAFARELGILSSEPSEERRFWEAEREKVYSTWAEDLDTYAPPVRGKAANPAARAHG